jgi:hypothetical protein
MFTDRTGAARASMSVDSRGVGTVNASDRGQSAMAPDISEDSNPGDTSGD